MRSGKDTKECGLSSDTACRTLTHIARVLSKNPRGVALGNLQIITDVSIYITQDTLVCHHTANIYSHRCIFSYVHKLLNILTNFLAIVESNGHFELSMKYVKLKTFNVLHSIIYLSLGWTSGDSKHRTCEV